MYFEMKKVCENKLLGETIYSQYAPIQELAFYLSILNRFYYNVLLLYSQYSLQRHTYIHRILDQMKNLYRIGLTHFGLKIHLYL